MEQVGGRSLPRTNSGEIDMNQIHADNLWGDPATRQEFETEVLGRLHLNSPDGAFMVSDAITPERLKVYQEGARRNPAVEVAVDTTGEISGRAVPEEGWAWVVIRAVDDHAFGEYDLLITPHLLEVINQEDQGMLDA